jgi:hypothetical protein
MHQEIDGNAALSFIKSRNLVRPIPAGMYNWAPIVFEQACYKDKSGEIFKPLDSADMYMWDLAWLFNYDSMKYLVPGPTQDFVKAMRAQDPDLLACITLDVFNDTNYILEMVGSLTPVEFITGMMAKPYQSLEIWKDYGDPIFTQARQVAPILEKNMLGRMKGDAPPPSSGNIIQFRRK